MALAAVTVAAFFVVQHLKISTPLLAGNPAPHPAAINPIGGQVCRGTSHRSMQISFYLQNRSDDVDVDIVDTGGMVVASLASGVHMQGGRHPVRRPFAWDGRTSSGVVAADGIYYVRVSLIHQGRYVLISDSAGSPLPVTVKTVAPHPRVTAVTPGLIPRAGVAGAVVRYTGNAALPGRMLIFRTDLPGAPRLVKSFPARVGLRVTDRACNTGSFPAVLPPVAGTTAHAGVSVRYLAGLPPLTPVAAGAAATVFVDARRHGYAWALRQPGADRVLASGGSRAIDLHVPLPSQASRTGLYQLALRYGVHRTLVPIVGAPPAASARVLVVLPALTWQALNPVDDDGDGVPNTLSAGSPVRLSTVFPRAGERWSRCSPTCSATT